ncbi:MAG: hypothetical protein NZ805_14790 [Armatimonadetes bacterium]|nr:hypothetical protein [Armatimonadota bacterium]
MVMLKRAKGKAEVLKRAGVWAVPFVIGSEWAEEGLKEEAVKQKVICVVDGKIEPSRSDWEQLEQIVAHWKPS